MMSMPQGLMAKLCFLLVNSSKVHMSVWSPWIAFETFVVLSLHSQTAQKECYFAQETITT